MAFDESKYRTGYSIGVGGVVVCGSKALLVRRAWGTHAGDWAIPGGFVERGETADVAVRREVLEEADVETEIEGVIAVRSRVTDIENSAYLLFLLRATDERARADGREVDEAGCFTLSEIQVLEPLQALSRLVTSQALRGRTRVLTFHTHPKYAPDEYVIYA